MPTIVPSSHTKSNINDNPTNKTLQHSNLSFPFGQPFGHKGFGTFNEKIKNYRHNATPGGPTPGEGLPRVIHYCADQSGCAFWRMIWPGDELLAHNKAVVMTLYQMVNSGAFYGGIDAVRLQRQCNEHQLLFVKFLRNVSDEMKAQTGKGFRLIWEVDDSIFAIPDYNVCKAAWVDESIAVRVKEIVHLCDEMTTVSEYMAEIYRKNLDYNKVTVIPNYAPKTWIDRGYDPERILENYWNTQDKPRILYAGSGTHFDIMNNANQEDDFGHVVDKIVQDITIHKKYTWVFLGAIPNKLRQFIGTDGVEFHGWTAVTDYPQTMKDLKVNVSIAPLQGNSFSRAKANIKLTEAGAQGIPCIAQNLECYNSDGWQYLFDTADELFDKIANVLKDRETYMAASAFARKYSENYFLQDHLDEYTLLYTTEYGDPKRKENATFLKNNPNQFGI